MKSVKSLLLLLLTGSFYGIALAANGGTVQVRNLTDKDAAISMDGTAMCTAKAHTDNVVRGEFCSFRASNGTHQIGVVFSDGRTGSVTVSFSDDDPADIKVITLYPQ